MTQDPGRPDPDPYGSPPPSYGSQPPSYGSDPYGQPPAYQPPAAPQYGSQPPSYGEQPPSYGEQPPPYGSQPPPYGEQPPPAYGQQPYGQPPAYGQQPYGQPPVYGQPSGPGAPMSPNDERQMSMFAHLGGILGCIGWLPSLIIWSIHKDKSVYVRDQARVALNFQLTALIGYIVVWVASLVVGSFSGVLGSLFSLLNFLLWVGVVIFSIMSGIAANKGEAAKYPFSLDLVK